VLITIQSGDIYRTYNTESLDDYHQKLLENRVMELIEMADIWYGRESTEEDQEE
jgi:histidinol phosphatase-like enzyme